MATIQISDATLYYRESGYGSPLLLIHGSGANADVGVDAVRLLAQHHRVISYDRRGHSRSGSQPAPLSGYLQQQARDAAALLMALDAAPATVVGWSMGGVIALCLALEHPELVARLVLAEPPLHTAKRPPPIASLWPMLKTKLLSVMGRKQAAMETFFRMLLARPDGGNAYDDLDDGLRRAVLENAATFLHELDTGTGEEMSAERIKELRCPVSAITGGATLSVFSEATRYLSQILPQMRLAQIPGAGHVTILTHPDDFAQLALQA